MQPVFLLSARHHQQSFIGGEQEVGAGFDLFSFFPSVFLQALPPCTLNPSQRQEKITLQSPALSCLEARGPLQLVCRHLLAGWENRRGVLAEGRMEGEEPGEEPCSGKGGWGGAARQWEAGLCWL